MQQLSVSLGNGAARLPAAGLPAANACTIHAYALGDVSLSELRLSSNPFSQRRIRQPPETLAFAYQLINHWYQFGTIFNTVSNY